MTNLIALPSGTELVGDYRIERVLGAGGFGVTYLATEIALARRVTIKEYFPADFAARSNGIDAAPRSQGSDVDYRWGLDRFIEEAQTLAKFNHPHIVRVYRYFRANNTGYMVLHFEEGQSFKSWLKGLGRAPRQKELDGILEPLLDALSLIHDSDFLHRDIAPDNIIIRKDGTPVLIDFGSARGEIATNSKTVSALVKPGYSPYEQYAATSRQQGPWTDIYALGATLYHAVSGKRPPDSPSRMVKDEIIPAATAALSSYRPRFLEAVDRALALQVDQRPQSIAAWRGDLLAPAEEEAAGGGLFGIRRGARKKKLPAAGDRDVATVPLAGAEQISPAVATPPPPDAPGPQGGMIDFFDRFRNKEEAAPGRQGGQGADHAANKRRSLAAALAGAEDGAADPSAAMAPDSDAVLVDVAPVPDAPAASSAATVKLDTLVKPISFPGWRRRDREKVAKKKAGPGKPANAKAKLKANGKAAKGAGGKAKAMKAAAEPAKLRILPPAVIERRMPPKPRPARSSRRWLTSLGVKLLIGVGVATGAVMIQQEMKNFPAAEAPEPSTKQAAGKNNAATRSAATTVDADARRRPRQTGSISERPALAASIPLVTQIPAHASGATAVAFAGGDKQIVSIGKDGMLSIWDAQSGTLQRTIMLDHGSATSLSVHGQKAVTGHEDGHVDVWDLEAGSKVASFRRNEASVWSVAFTDNGQRVAAAGHDWKVALWDVKAHAQPVHVFDSHKNAVQAVAYSAAGPYLATGSADKSVHLWRLGNFEKLRTYRRHGDFISSLAFAPGGNRLAAGALNGEIRLWSPRSRRLQRRLRGHKRAVKGLAFSPSGSLLASASLDGTVRLWSMRSGRAITTLAHQATGASGIVFNASGTRMVTAGADGTLRIWDLSRYGRSVAER